MAIDSKPKTEDVTLLLFEERVNTLLAEDDASSYSLKRIATSLENSSIVIHNPSEALLSEFISQRDSSQVLWFKLENLNSGGLTILLGIICLMGFFQFRIRQILLEHQKLVNMIGVSTALLPMAWAKSFQLLKRMGTTTVTPVWEPEYIKSLVAREESLTYSTITINLISAKQTEHVDYINPWFNRMQLVLSFTIPT